jgi:hypothetical protein
MAEKFNVTGEQHFGITGQMLEIQKQIRRRGGSPINPKLVSIALQRIIEGEFQSNSILRLLTSTDELIIKATDGKRFLAKAKDTFESDGIDSNFKILKLDQESHATIDTPINVYEMIESATFAQIFRSLSNNLDKLCLTQDQIEEFCLSHRDQLRTGGYNTFFLFKENKYFFVANVAIGSRGLYVYVSRLNQGHFVWDGHNRNRVVVPQLTF